MNILFHGNFESAADWDFLSPQWKVFPLWQFIKENNFSNWKKFSDSLSVEIKKEKPERLAGYSLGGRILLELSEYFPETPLTFISTYPGLPTEEERTARLWTDLKWKERVLTENWEELYYAWNAQPVFGADPEKSYKNFAELDNYREEIAEAFDLLSLGRMRNFNEIPFPTPQKIHWICGEADQKFHKLGETLAKKTPINFLSFPNSGHRIHKKSPADLLAMMEGA